MSQERQPGTIEAAIAAGDYLQAFQAVGLKVARILDRCECTRDIRPLVGALFETIDKINKYSLEHNNGRTPLDAILEEAEYILANPDTEPKDENE